MKRLAIIALILLAALGGLAILLLEGDLPKAQVDARYSSPASRFLDLGPQGRIHYRDQGNRQGMTLILLHGSNASLHAWEPWVQLLQDDYRLVSLDLPGHGLTGEAPNNDYSISAYVKVVEALGAALDLRDPALVGNSMGGRVALSYTLAHPDEVRALALVASGGLQVQPPAASNRQPPLVFTLLQYPWFQALATRLDTSLLLGQGLLAAYNDPALVTDQLKQRYYHLNMRAGTRAATVRRFQQGRTPLTEAAIASIQTPTLIMWGKQDALTPFAAAQRFAQLIPQAQTAYYNHLGHLPMEEAPAPTAQALHNFLQTAGLH